MSLTIRVHGLPAPQGSKRHVGNGVMVESSKRVKPWREAVKWAALERRDIAPTMLGPLVVSIDFYLPRPRGHYRTGRNSHLLRDGAPTRPAGRPDLDKLIRSTLDGLGEAAVWKDDAQVVELTVGKHYDEWPAGTYYDVGAVIRVGETA